jgi:hypothetical protein
MPIGGWEKSANDRGLFPKEKKTTAVRHRAESAKIGG